MLCLNKTQLFDYMGDGIRIAAAPIYIGEMRKWGITVARMHLHMDHES